MVRLSTFDLGLRVEPVAARVQGNYFSGSSQTVFELWVSTVGTRNVGSELVFGRVVTVGIRAKVTPDSSSVYSLGRYMMCHSRMKSWRRVTTADEVLPVEEGHS